MYRAPKPRRPRYAHRNDVRQDCCGAHALSAARRPRRGPVLFLLTFRARKLKAYIRAPATGAGAYCNATTLAFDDALGDREAESHPRGRGIAEPDKFLEYAVVHFVGDPRSLVGYIELDRPVVNGRAYGDNRTAGRVFCRVLQNVVNDLG